MKVGDYVRTKYGIAKIIDLKENPYGEKTIYVIDNAIINIEDLDGDELFACNPFIDELQDRFDTNFGDEKCIIKSSPNIIDLIEAGDYINGDRVVENAYEPEKLYVENIYVGGKGQTTIENYSYELTSKYCYDEPDFIKSIVTKEQFESMKYEVK